jgi:hypothetical protein
MDETWFTLEESAALLHFIFPEWPGVRGHRDQPADLQAWLRQLRQDRQAETAKGAP